MNRVLEVDADAASPGSSPACSTSTSPARSPHLGLHYAPDPSSQQACTIGGNVGTNAGGPHCLAAGVTSAHVLAVEVVLADGSVVACSAASTPDTPGPRPAGRLRRQRGHDGHRHRASRCGSARPAGGPDPPARLHRRSTTRPPRERHDRGRDRARGARDDGCPDHPGGRGLRRRRLPARCRGGAARRGRPASRRVSRSRPTRSTGSAGPTARARCGSRRTRRARPAVEGAEVGIRCDRPHRTRLLPPRRGGPAHEARRGAPPRLRDRRPARAHHR